MELLSVWNILGVAGIVLLIIFWGKKNAVWGGLMMGVILGILIALGFLFKNSQFDWILVQKITTILVWLGFFSEMLGKFADRRVKK